MKSYANCHLGTDVLPYQVLKVVSEKTIHVRSMKAIPSKDHNMNNNAWSISPDENAEILVVRKHKGKDYFSLPNSPAERFYLADKPVKHYDYGF